MKRALVFVLVVAIVTLAAVAAPAQQGRRLTLEPRLSYWLPDSADNAVGFGAALEVMVSEWFGLVAAIDFWSFEGDSVSATLDAVPEWDIRDLSVGAVFYIGTAGSVSPYVVAGFDYFMTGDDFGGADAGAFATAGVDDTLGWHIGAGVDFALGKNVSLVIEGRYFDTSINVDLTDIEIGDVDVTGFAILAGVEFGF